MIPKKKIIKIKKREESPLIAQESAPEPALELPKKKIIKIKRTVAEPLPTPNTNKNKKNAPTNQIQPLVWVLPNKKIFNNWINETFIKYKSTGKSPQFTKGQFRPFAYQRFLRDLMQDSSPYRGILLYHGLGSGKTCSTILIADNRKSNAVVIAPASLRDNFINDGLKFCGRAGWEDKYVFISSNASNTVQQIAKIGSLNNYSIVLEEEHNLISRIVGGLRGENKQGKMLYELLMEARDCKIIALSGTPIINKPYEFAILCNILRGYIYLTYFRVLAVNEEKYGGKVWKINLIADLLKKNEKYVDYIDLNQKNMTLEVHLLIKPWNPIFNQVVQHIIEIMRAEQIEVAFDKYERFTLFPDGADGKGEAEFDDLFIDYREGKIKNRDVFQRRILGLVSYYRSRTENFPRLKGIEMIHLPMSPYQFTKYMEVRKVEKSSRKLAEIRIFSREYSNFVFPLDIVRPGIGEKIASADMDVDVESVAKAENTKSETEIEGEGEVVASKEYIQAVDASIKKLMAGADKYLKVDADLGIYSPKMRRILEIAESVKGLVYVYSNFRSLEGIEIFSKVLETNGYKEYKKGGSGNEGKGGKGKHYMFFTGRESPEERSANLRVFNSSDNMYGNLIKFILVTTAGAEGLDLKNIRQVHIMEPYWNETKIKQIIGRAVRRNSHIELPETEREVMVYRYFATIPEKEKKELPAKERESTDEVVYDLAKKKGRISDEIFEMAKEASVDCLLNSADNEQTIKCYNFAVEEGNKESLASHPQLRKDLGMAVREEATREKKVELVKGFVDKEGKIYYVSSGKVYSIDDTSRATPINMTGKNAPKVAKKVAIDMAKRELYDYDIAMEKKTKVKVGTY